MRHFFEISKEQFEGYQRNAEKKLRSLIYRNTDIELANGNSEVTFYNLCYAKEKPQARENIQNTTMELPRRRREGQNHLLPFK